MTITVDENKPATEQAKEILFVLKKDVRDAIYDATLFERVCGDIVKFCDDVSDNYDVEIDPGDLDIEGIAKRCIATNSDKDLAYWGNIERLVLDDLDVTSFDDLCEQTMDDENGACD